MVGGQSPDSCSLISEVRSEGLFRRGLLRDTGRGREGGGRVRSPGSCSLTSEAPLLPPCRKRDR